MLCIRTTFSLLIDSLFGGHLGSLHFLVIGNKAAINTDVQVCLELDIKSSTYTRSGTAWLYSNSISRLPRNSQADCQSAYTSLCYPTVHKGYHSDTASDVIPGRFLFRNAFYIDVESLMKPFPHLKMEKVRPRDASNHIALRTGSLLSNFETSDQ